MSKVSGIILVNSVYKNTTIKVSSNPQDDNNTIWVSEHSEYILKLFLFI